MNPPAWPDHARPVECADDLRVVLSPAVNLAIWRRDAVPCGMADRLDAVDDIGCTIAVDRLADDVPVALAVAGYAADDAARLGGDIADLGRRIGMLGAAARVAIRLEVVEGDACRRFHADYVTIRLICTYVGPGTQWIDNAAAVALAGGADPATLPIRAVATGDVALFKGRDWAGDMPIIHRSPPIAQTGDRRLVLVIDPVSAVVPAGPGTPPPEPRG